MENSETVRILICILVFVTHVHSLVTTLQMYSHTMHTHANSKTVHTISVLSIDSRGRTAFGKEEPPPTRESSLDESEARL
jgi:hypothetical protein